MGAGSIGGTVAGELLRADGDVTVVTGNPGITKAINESGIRLKTPEREFRVDARAHDKAGELADLAPFDAVLLATKADSVLETAQDALPFLAEDGCMLTLQNGIVGDDLSEAIGVERVLSASVGFAASMHGPGIYERTTRGALHIGEHEGPATARVRKLAQALSAVTEIKVEDNMIGALWSKLAVNTCITSMGALTGLKLGPSLSHREVREAFLIIYRETIDTAVALGVKPEPIAADPWLMYMPVNAGALTRAFKHLLVRIVGARYRNLKSSSLQSLERGRKTEMQHINGRVVKAARSIGREAPANQLVCELVGEIEEGERKSALENVSELLAALSRN
jgi:2-dehydropantoate 2-reductase